MNYTCFKTHLNIQFLYCSSINCSRNHNVRINIVTVPVTRPKEEKIPHQISVFTWRTFIQVMYRNGSCASVSRYEMSHEIPDFPISFNHRRSTTINMCQIRFRPGLRSGPRSGS